MYPEFDGPVPAPRADKSFTPPERAQSSGKPLSLQAASRGTSKHQSAGASDMSPRGVAQDVHNELPDEEPAMTQKERRAAALIKFRRKRKVS